ncbi:porin family protein [bacterium]|nr:MAG: porin family protein [bacterium]
MKKLKVLAALVLAALVCAPVFAADGFATPYFGGTLNFQEIEPDGGGSDADPIGITAILGGFVHRNIALEGRLGLGIIDDSVQGVDVINDYNLGVYARGVFFADKFMPYFLLGLSTAKVSVDWDGGSDSETDSGLSIGLGADYKFQPNMAANIEWISIVNGDDYDLTSLNLGVRYYF